MAMCWASARILGKMLADPVRGGCQFLHRQRRQDQHEVTADEAPQQPDGVFGELFVLATTDHGRVCVDPGLHGDHRTPVGNDGDADSSRGPTCPVASAWNSTVAAACLTVRQTWRSEREPVGTSMHTPIEDGGRSQRLHPAPADARQRHGPTESSAARKPPAPQPNPSPPTSAARPTARPSPATAAASRSGTSTSRRTSGPSGPAQGEALTERRGARDQLLRA